MIFEGYIKKDSKSKYWAIGIEALDIHTQGTSEKNAYEMLRDAISSLAEVENEKLSKFSAVSFMKCEAKGRFNVSFDHLEEMLGFILNRMRFESNLSLSELSKKLGKKSRTVVQRYMAGKSIPTIDSFAKLTGAMGYQIKMVKNA